MKAKGGTATPKTYLIEVVPISRSPLAETLSYFSSRKLVPGTLVKVPVKSKLVPAVVTMVKDIRDVKAFVRRAGFALRKVRQSDVCEAALDHAFLEAVRETARYYVTSVGHLLAAILPKMILNEPETFLAPFEGARPQEEKHREMLLLQMEGEERLGQYRALVRQAFARGASALLLVPTHHDAARMAETLSTGISEFVYTFSLEGKTVAMKEVWRKAREEKHPILFITTSAGLSFSRSDLDLVVVERANSRAYRTLARPYIDFRFLAEKLAKKHNFEFVLGDSVLPIETLWRERSGELGVSEASLIRWRLPAAPARLVDASAKQNEAGRFEIFSLELKQLITKALEEKERIFLFGARKGLAPTTVCGDCGTLLPCTNCGAPVVLHRRNEANMYVCHACGAIRDSSTLCGTCKSWKLVPLGSGTEVIARKARALFPKVAVDILDKDHAPTDTEAREIAQKFKEKGSILVGTELAFFHLEPVAYSAVVSVDALFSIPDFHVNERIFYLVSRLRELSRHECLIQSRNIGRQILSWASSGSTSDFYKDEIAEREALAYPPFSVFVTVSAPQPEGTKGAWKLKEEFIRWHPDIFRHTIVMRIPRAEWPSAELFQKLSLLPPEFNVKVDPESLM